MATPSEDVPATDETATSATSSDDAPAPPRRRPRRTKSSETPSSADESAVTSDGGATALAPLPETSWRASASSAPAAPALDPVPVAVVDDAPTTSWRDRNRAAEPEPVSSGQGTFGRYYRQTVTKVDLWSVTKLSLCFYLSAMFVTMVALVILWMIADAAGIIASVEKFFGDLLSAKDFHFLSAQVLRGAILVALVVVALQVVLTVIAASFYNIFAELFGGIEIVVREEEDVDDGYEDSYR